MQKSKGQGLIEVLITFLVITGSILALIYFQNYLAYSNNLSQQQNTALTLAINKIESLRDFSSLSGANSYQSIATGTSTYTGTSATYTISWTITTNTNPDYKQIDVTVTWQDRRSVSQTIRLVSRVGGVDPSYSGTVMS